MAKRVLWLKEEFILVLGLYLKIPYFNGVVPSFQDVVNIIKNKFGISRTISSIQIRLANFESCDPARINLGYKGMDAGKRSCMPYWQKFSNDKRELLSQLNLIMGKDSLPYSTTIQLQPASVEEPKNNSWSKMESIIALYLALTRVPAKKDNPLIIFFGLWFNHPIEEVVLVVDNFTKLFRHETISHYQFRALCDETFSEFEKKPNVVKYAARLVWSDIITKSFQYFPEAEVDDVINNIDTVVVEDSVFEVVRRMNAEGFSKFKILSTLMNQFAEKGLSISEWNKIISEHISSLSPEKDNSDTYEQPNIAEAKSVTPIEASSNSDSLRKGKHKQRRTADRIKLKYIKVDGHIIEEASPTEMFVQFIKFVDPELVSYIDIPFRGGQLVSKQIHPLYVSACKDVGKGFYLNTNCNTQAKITYMQKIADELGISFEYETYLKKTERI